eukprot:gnl/TRDRNA2_/TRDRNA2_148773_c1_seq1.p2 gnl/TRDRNA2_/TRDRNA2_148773_c1~~gnl/TRDRNA2_/TRDRNA2_148773_c1_seq1.p2  ORF type:complete len:126 (+),score=12.42 gnl/TRDRNA2_/TRDRNA2_148773_c1_seq1:133-510(+)
MTQSLHPMAARLDVRETRRRPVLRHPLDFRETARPSPARRGLSPRQRPNSNEPSRLVPQTGSKDEKPMARKPNYSFERRERDRLKAEKKAKRAAEKKAASEPTDEQSETTEHSDPSSEQDDQATT